MWTKSKVLVIAIVAALGLSACSGSSDGRAGESGKQTLVVGDVGGWAKSHFAAAGLLDDLPYEIEFKDLAGASAYAALSSGQVDVGVWGFDANGAKTIVNGSDARIIGLIGRADDSDASKAQGNINLFVSKNSGIGNLADLKGKKIGVNWGEGTTADVVLHGALAEAKLTKGDLEVKYFTDATGNTAYLSGQLDGFITSVNAALVEDINKGETQILYYANQASAVSYVITSTESKIADAHKKDAIADWVGRVTRYYEWRGVSENAQGFGKAVAEQMSVDQALGNEVGSYIAQTVQVQEFSDDRIADYQADLDLLKDWELLDETIDATALIDTSFAAQIAAAKQPAKG